MIKRVAVFILAVCIIIFSSGCKNDTALNNSDEKIECPICGLMNSMENNFCSACGCGIKASNGNPVDFDNETLGQIDNVAQNYNLLSYFKSVSDKPLILYDCKIAKDSKVGSAYVIKNGQCRLYYCSTTLGKLSKMTDDEIIEMLEDEYQDGLVEALSIWKDDYATNKAILNGKVRLYKPSSYEIKGCLFTDDTGNAVVGELLFFPKAGIGGSPYVIEYPQFTDAQDRFMNYYGTFKDSDSPWDIKFNIKYFNTGWGTSSDINQINNMYYVEKGSMQRGTVYNSNYYSIESMDSEWVEGRGTLCFRVENPSRFNLRLDTLSSPNVSCIDPTVNDILQISSSYYNAYYSNFEMLD